MRKLKNVIGSKEASKNLIIGKDTVYIHSNVRVYEDKNEENKAKISELYIYDEVQMSLHEYLEVKQQELELMTKAQNSTEDLLQEIILKMYEV
ncbi:hypothetical protein [Anaerococcus rubeinfantis]|uniref:hypothetical protein n=1 Tax=Anaerococcus rubeinfantis TaxID=1720199 RepID=UPI00073F80EB|nr:hypothetical protein [Anaerococcus rubeinfantis]